MNFFKSKAKFCLAALLAVLGACAANSGRRVAPDVSFLALTDTFSDRFSYGNATFSFNAANGAKFTLWPSGVMIDADASPFIAAGLNVSENIKGVMYNSALGRLYISPTPARTLEMSYDEPDASFAKYMERRGYVIALKDGYMVNDGLAGFFWDDASSSASILIDFAPLAAAGLNPEAVEGWVLIEVAPDGQPALQRLSAALQIRE